MSQAQLRGGASRTMDALGPTHVVDYGGVGPTVVLVHGLGGSHLNWMLVGPSLANRYRVLAIDLPGFGLTAPEGRSAAVSSQAEVVAELIRRHVGGPATVMGNSMGGLVAMLAADLAPELISSLVLVDPALPPQRLTAPSADTLRFLAMPLVPLLGPRWTAHLRATRSPAEQVNASMDFVAADPDRIPEEVRTAGIAMEEARRRMPWSTTAFAEAGRSIAATLARKDRLERTIHAIGAPVLLIHGEHDEVVPVDGAHWVQRLRPDWDVVMLDGVGHVAQLEVPDLFLELVTEWLAAKASYVPVPVSS